MNIYIKSKYTHVLWPKTPGSPCMESYFMHGYWNGITLINNEDIEGFEGCCFLSSKDNESINYFYIKHSNVLEKFFEHFKIIFSDSINNSSLENKNLATFTKGVNYILPPKVIETTENIIEAFFNTMNISSLNIDINGRTIKLTRREKQCFDLLGKGYSTKTIGKELLLSPRTVEVHLNNLKNKTGMYSKSSLMQIYNQLI